jgi:hypothetical protein
VGMALAVLALGVATRLRRGRAQGEELKQLKQMQEQLKTRQELIGRRRI